MTGTLAYLRKPFLANVKPDDKVLILTDTAHDARVWQAVQREDKNIFGAIHLGLGTNIDVGGTLRSNIHMDGVILQPTITVDGEERVRGGRFRVPLGD